MHMARGTQSPLGRYRGETRQPKQVNVVSDPDGAGQRLNILGFRVPREEHPGILADIMHVGVDVGESLGFCIDSRKMRLWKDLQRCMRRRTRVH